MEKVYQPQKTEKKIYELWEESGAFSPKIKIGKKPFSVIMPPPNANAPIHVGFGVNVSVEDLMIRYHRMKGEPTLWLPGADHAGILTQVVYERQLAEKGLTRHDLGREKFFKEIMDFTLNNKKIMQSQIKALGGSCDWKKDSFTLDPKFDKPIFTLFKKLYDKGLIYRAERIVNWCPRCQTALSDLEIEHREEKTKLYFIRYVLKKEDRFLTVATTRPETMLGDTAVAVNPKDKRYQDLIGKTVVLPLMLREIPIIADKLVDIKFGPGAVKVTPTHDPVDFEIGQRNSLASIQVIGFDNKMTRKTGKYAGLSLQEAKELIIQDLEAKGLLEKTEDYVHSVGHCERCKTLVEPQVSLQWFVKTKPLARKAAFMVKSKKIKIIPFRFEKIYLLWMKEIRDWCISRQLWWGHQLPVWYCGSENLSSLQKLMNPELSKLEDLGCGEIIVSIEKPKECPKCGNKNLIHDPDTLDTWFSSGQWPFNTLGWPEKTKDFQYFYPTSIMETGYEILFFWVARMIMLGLFATGKIPFETVYLHGMVRDVFGKKMSKSRPETCIDPMETVVNYGADALRMALVMGNAPGRDSSLSEDKIKGMRNFANKIWNAARFVLSHKSSIAKQQPSKHPDDAWILEELEKTTKSVTDDIEKFRLGQAAEELYEFFWHKFCDKYIEASKSRRNEAQPTLLFVLETSLKLLHPFMPFITEEIYQKMPGHKKPLIVTPWPKN